MARGQHHGVETSITREKVIHETHSRVVKSDTSSNMNVRAGATLNIYV